MRKPLIAGNWKMHGSHTMLQTLLPMLKQNIHPTDVAEMAVFPPFVFLDQTQQLLKDSQVQWGAQNLSAESQGAYTGEVSGAMLAEFGCRYVLIGHSERRTLYGETDALIAKKFAMAQQVGLCPVLCLGETLEQREQGLTQQIVEGQLNAVLDHVGIDGFQNAVLAYEPVWAIGTGLTATPEQAQAVHAMLRQRIASQSPTIAAQLRILYGGSVKAAGAKALFTMPDIDGGLIGGASLVAEDFLQIYRAVG